MSFLPLYAYANIMVWGERYHVQSSACPQVDVIQSSEDGEIRHISDAAIIDRASCGMRKGLPSLTALGYFSFKNEVFWPLSTTSISHISGRNRGCIGKLLSVTFYKALFHVSGVHMLQTFVYGCLLIWSKKRSVEYELSCLYDPFCYLRK